MDGRIGDCAPTDLRIPSQNITHEPYLIEAEGKWKLGARGMYGFVRGARECRVICQSAVIYRGNVGCLLPV